MLVLRLRLIFDDSLLWQDEGRLFRLDGHIVTMVDIAGGEKVLLR